MSDNSNDMQALTGRTERLVDSLTGAIMSTMETAAQRIELASRVAQITQRMAAFTTVLEVIAAQKEPILRRLDALGNGPADRVMRTMLTRQIEVFSEQELSVLEKAGAPREAAQKAVEMIDHEPESADPNTVPVKAHTRRRGAVLNGHAE